MGHTPEEMSRTEPQTLARIRGAKPRAGRNPSALHPSAPGRSACRRFGLGIDRSATASHRRGIASEIRPNHGLPPPRAGTRSRRPVELSGDGASCLRPAYRPRGSLMSPAFRAAFAFAVSLAFWASVWGTMGVTPSRLAPGCVLSGISGIGLAATRRHDGGGSQEWQRDRWGLKFDLFSRQEPALRRWTEIATSEFDRFPEGFGPDEAGGKRSGNAPEPVEQKFRTTIDRIDD